MAQLARPAKGCVGCVNGRRLTLHVNSWTVDSGVRSKVQMNKKMKFDSLIHQYP